MQQAEKKGLIKHGVKNGFIIGFTLVFALGLWMLLDGQPVGWNFLLFVPLFFGVIGAVIGLVVEVVINHQRLHSPPKEELEEESEDEYYEEEPTQP